MGKNTSKYLKKKKRKKNGERYGNKIEPFLIGATFSKGQNKRLCHVMSKCLEWDW